jgi:hypothetical protein
VAGTLNNPHHTGKVNNMVKADTATGEVVEYTRLSNEELAGLGTSQEELEAFLATLGLTIDEALFVASDFALTEKSELVGVPLFIIQWVVNTSEEYGGLYSVVHAVRMDDATKVVFADGSTGIHDQLQIVTMKRKDAKVPARAWQAGVAVPNGLVRSDYPAGIGRDGNERPAGTTFYLG